MRILISGASGFIGRSVVEDLARSHSVIIIGRKPSSAPQGIDFLSWDMSAPVPLVLPAGIDAVVHLAQSDQYRKGVDGARDMVQVNVSATAELLSVARMASVKRFCLASTGTVYEPFLGDIHENAVLAPESFLGATKLAAEILASPYKKFMDICVLRLFFPYGPGQVERLIPDLVRRVRTGVPIFLNGSGDGGKIVPTYVGDISGVISSAVENAWQGTLNIASPAPVSIRELSEKIGELLGSKPVFEMRPDRNPLDVVPILDRFKAVYSLQRLTSLDEGLRKTVFG